MIKVDRNGSFFGEIRDHTKLQEFADSHGIPVSELSIDILDMRDIKRQEVNNMRDITILQGVVVSGYTYQTDPVSMTNMIGVVNMISAGVPLPANFTWRTMENVDAPHDAASMINVYALAAGFVSDCYKVGHAHKDAIDISSDPENYDVTTNWPSNVLN